MKVCLITNHFYPEYFKINDVAFELNKLGYDVTVLTAIPDYPEGKFFDGYSIFKHHREIVNGATVIRLPIIPRGKGRPINLILNYISYFITLSIFVFFHSITTRYDYVFVHLTSPFFIGLPAVYLKKMQRIPLFFWSLDLWPESLISAGGISNPIIIKPQVKMVSWVYKNCDKILIGSRGFAKSICEKGDFKEKLVYFPNWAETIDDNMNDSLLVQVQPFCTKQPDDFILLFAGNIGEAQNLDAVIEVAHQLKENRKIKFVFIGDGRNKDHLKSLSSAYGLSETVFFPGRFPIDSMPLFMSHASVLMVTLKDEPCFNLTVPSKVQFYMAQGKPLVAMLNGDGADLINEAKCGIAVPAGDTEAFKNAVLQLYKMPSDDIQKLGKNGRVYYLVNFQKEQRIKQLDELFKAVLPAQEYVLKTPKKIVT